MYETRSVRPYYTIPHLGCFGAPFKRLVGFSYTKTIYVTSPDMHNAAYFDETEMQRASRHFGQLWKNARRTRAVLMNVRTGFRKAIRAEAWAWKQDWSRMTTPHLLILMRKYDALIFHTFGTMIISQPQHVVPLEATMRKLLDTHTNADELLRIATTYVGDLPWAQEERIIARLHTQWKRLSTRARNRALDHLVDEYGWFNEIEGERPFDRTHYRKKILAHHRNIPAQLSSVRVPPQIRRVGQLIGQLGFLRFWNRYHFMHIRYHLKKMLEELVRRSGVPDLAYATVEEIDRYFQHRKIDLQEIRRRKRGYTSMLRQGKTCILTNAAARNIARSLQRTPAQTCEIRGTIANKGLATGRVRIVSFSAKDYNEQVARFQKGEILVTGMTRPQIVHLCQKAAAIVTDEGGITSHAAVVSRELNIPCIIATRNATNLLKTGDRVEVDAKSGIVKKL